MQKDNNEKSVYDPKNIEEKWVKIWQDEKVYKTADLEMLDKNKPKMHVLDMFPYPSGEGLHTGHTKIFGASDSYARFKRMQGYNVMHATGWDAFGLPAEQYAIKNKTNPKISTKKNTENFERQMKMLGLSYDWDRTVNTTDPAFYKWTQWIFKQLYKKGLCYESFEPINWCPSCKTGLANEDLEDGKCERCGSVVEKKPIRQWVIRITDYAEKLLQGVDGLAWKESIKEMQRNWIGESEGAEIDFDLKALPEGEGLGGDSKFTIFTTRPDTLFGCTYCVFAPEHKLIKEYLDKGIITNKEEVEKYINDAKNKTEIERTNLEKEKTGVKLEGLMAINPANQKEIPVYIADYVLASYGTGAIMAVPAHDERDAEFANKFGIEKTPVIAKVFKYSGDDGFREGAETLYREVVDVILENDKNEFLLIKEKNNGITHFHFIGGGVENGQSQEDAIFAETKEESGYIDVKIVRRNIFPNSVSAFRHTKNKNQVSFGTFNHVKLNSDNKVKSEVDEGKHEMLWVKKEEVENLITWQAHKDAWLEFISGEESIFTDEGLMMNSKEFNFMESQEAKKKITEFVGGKMVKKYKLRDWVFARQRYWGEPFPIVFDENHKAYLVADSELPVVLPDVESYEPTGDGEGPLKNIKEWLEVKGRINEDGEFVSDESGKTFYRETNTMPQWAGSSWYWLRYLDPHNNERLIGVDEEKYWSQNGYSVDMYLGGLEHATRHLIYGRFWNIFLNEIGVLTHSEPFKRLEAVGLVLGEGGVKMSKRLGNVVNPDEMVKMFGADTLRLYIAFAASYHDSFAWDTKAIVGPRRFIERVWGMQYKVAHGGRDLEGDIETLLNQTIKKVGEDYEKLQFNTAVAQMMIFLNAIEKESNIALKSYKILLQLLAPICPFVTEEIWNILGEKESIHKSIWPKYDESKIINKKVNIAVQINGKLRDVFEIETDASDEKVIDHAKKTEGYIKWVAGNEPKKVIVVKNKIVNIII